MMCRRARVECAERRSRDGVGGAETVGHETREKREGAGGRESRVRVGCARARRETFLCE